MSELFMKVDDKQQQSLSILQSELGENIYNLTPSIVDVFGVSFSGHKPTQILHGEPSLNSLS